MSEFVDAAVRAVREAAAALSAAGVAPEALAEYVPERRKLLIKRAATMRPLGEVWRLGTLLIAAGAGAATTDADTDTDATSDTGASAPMLYVVGRATRAAVRPYPGNQSVSREERRDLAAAALRGGYVEGTAVNFDAVPVALDEVTLSALPEELPIGVHDGQLRVRWRAGAPLAGAATLAAYLAERVDLLVNPPQGAGSAG